MFALFASFYLRFEGGDAFFARLPLLLRILPYFIVFSIVVCYVFKLTTTKWRFISLPDALNILRVASVLTFALVVLDYFLFSWRPSPQAPVFAWQGNYRSLLVSRGVFAERAALRLSLFPLYARSPQRPHRRGIAALVIGRAADAEVLLRGIESGAVKHLWPVGVLSPSIRRSRSVDTQYPGAGRYR